MIKIILNFYIFFIAFTSNSSAIVLMNLDKEQRKEIAQALVNSNNPGHENHILEKYKQHTDIDNGKSFFQLKPEGGTIENLRKMLLEIVNQGKCVASDSLTLQCTGTLNTPRDFLSISKDFIGLYSPYQYAYHDKKALKTKNVLIALGLAEFIDNGQSKVTFSEALERIKVGQGNIKTFMPYEP